MQQYIVLFLAPIAAMEEWMKTPEADRKAQEEKMKTDWDAWMAAHAGMIKETKAAGKTMRVTSAGAVEAKNDLMLFSMVEGESQEAVAKMFENHPHFGIPGATIEVTAIRAL